MEEGREASRRVGKEGGRKVGGEQHGVMERRDVGWKITAGQGGEK